MQINGLVFLELRRITCDIFGMNKEGLNFTTWNMLSIFSAMYCDSSDSHKYILCDFNLKGNWNSGLLSICLSNNGVKEKKNRPNVWI